MAYAEGMVLTFVAAGLYALLKGRWVLAGILGIFLSIFWRQVGVDHFHYQLYDSVTLPGEEDETPSSVLHALIHEVEISAGNARTDARVRAKAWLLSHAAALDEEDIQLARTHFGYMLPAGWGGRPS